MSKQSKRRKRESLVPGTPGRARRDPGAEDAIRAERRVRHELLEKGYSVEGGKPGLFDAHVPESSSKPVRRSRRRRASFPGPSRTIIVEPITSPDEELEPVEIPIDEPDREPVELPA